MVFKICVAISCSSFYVKEFDVIVHKSIFLYNPIKFLAILYPKSLANLVVEVGTRHNHQILFSLAVNSFIQLLVIRWRQDLKKSLATHSVNILQKMSD